MIHVLYRSSGTANRKNRPDFFDKAEALASFLRAMREAGPEVDALFLNDGPLTGNLTAWMRGAGEVLELPGIGNSGSYRRALDEALTRDWPDTDLVYLAEDDYLYLPGALRTLAEASKEIPAAAYFSLYDHPDRYRRDDDADRGRGRIFLGGGRHWRTVESTCLTYGVRPAALRGDAWIHRWKTRGPIPLDRDIWRAVQGLGRYRFKFPRRLLVSPIPALATHLEREYLSPGIDWAGAAVEARRWMEANLA
jgi:hypothetical protein